jgi:hypothetical protein
MAGSWAGDRAGARHRRHGAGEEGTAGDRGVPRSCAVTRTESTGHRRRLAPATVLPPTCPRRRARGRRARGERRAPATRASSASGPPSAAAGGGWGVGCIARPPAGCIPSVPDTPAPSPAPTHAPPCRPHRRVRVRTRRHRPVPARRRRAAAGAGRAPECPVSAP